MTARRRSKDRLKQARRSLLDPFAAALFGGGARLVGWLGERGAERLARLVAAGYRAASPDMRRIVAANLALAFPEESEDRRRTIARESFYHMCRNALEFLGAVRHPERALQRVDMASLRDCQALHDLQTAGQSALVVMPHLGSWELLGLAGSACGYPISAVAHPLRNVAIDQQVTAARQAFGLQVIPSQGAVAGLRQAARDRRILVLIMDQNTRTTEGGAFVDFFGVPVTMTRAPAVLARRLRLPLFAAACVRVGEQYRLVLEKLVDDAREFADDVALLQELALANERLIRAYPEQYIWTYKRWRYLPPGADDALAGRYPFYARPYDYT
jgi:lauroyl/myristoyl acyltransferase